MLEFVVEALTFLVFALVYRPWFRWQSFLEVRHVELCNQVPFHFVARPFLAGDLVSRPSNSVEVN